MENILKNRVSVLVIAFVLVIGTVIPGMMVLGSGEIGEGSPFEADDSGNSIVLVHVWNEEELEDISQHGEIIDHYGRNVLIETTPSGVQELESSYQVDRLEHRNEISVKGYHFDTNRGLPELDPELKIEDYGSGTEGLYVVDMIGPVNPEWRAELLEKGVGIVNYQPNYAYEVVMTPEQAEYVEDLFFVDWVGVYQPEFKLHSRLDEALDEDMSVNVRLRPGFEPSSLMQLESRVDVIGAENLRENGYRLVVDAEDMDELEDIAMMEDIYFISPYVEPELHAEMDIQLIGGGMWFMDDEYPTNEDLDPEPREGDPQEPYRLHGEYGAYINQLGYTGEGLTITTADTGIGTGEVGDSGVSDFTGRVIGGYGFGPDPDYWGDGHYHGTACTGLVAGDTHGGTGATWDEFEDGEMEYYMGQGLAYDSEIFATKIFDDGGGFLPDEYYPIVEEPAQRSDAYIHSNSWGAGTMGSYSDTDEVYDQTVRDADRDVEENRPMTITVSAGNDGGRGDYDQETGSPGNAKNVITVGGNQPYNPGLGYENPENMYDASSRGWTEDNRIKPDIIAPSESVISQNTPQDEPDTYISASGTSFGNPLAAGAATIVVDWYQQNYGETPSPALVKAILINTANELDPEIGDTRGHIPNRDEGWGVPDISKLEYPTDDPLGFEFVDQETLLETGDVEEYTVSVGDEDEPLKVTLTWTDKNALEGDSEGGTPTLKNNLDLEVETPGGEVIRGNAFDQTGDGVSDDGFTYPEAEVMADFDYNDDGWDEVNNVQNVFIHPDELESGSYTVRVMGTNVPEDANDDGEANQDFALSVYNVPDVTVPDKDGEIMFERDEYAGDEVVEITLSDVILEGEGTHDVNISSLDADGEELENMTVTLDEVFDDEGEPTGVFEGNVTLTEDPADEGLHVEHDGEIIGWYWDEDPGHPDDLEEGTDSQGLTEKLMQADDVGVTEILSPDELVNTEAQSVEVNVHNFGDNDQTDVPVNVTIGQEEILIHEDFSGEFPPTGWDTDDWTQSDSDNAGGEPPEAHLYYFDIEDDYSYLESAAVDTSGEDTLFLEFKSYIDCYQDGPFDADVSVRSEDGEGWTDITPWENPITSDVGPDSYQVDITDHIGPGTQVMFEFDGDSWNINNWYVDDVIFSTVDEEYTDETTVDVPSGENVTATFADWTPSEEGSFFMNATTELQGDEDPSNDYETQSMIVQDIHDVGITEIFSPTGSVMLDDTHEVFAEAENFGTFDEVDVPANATIEEFVYLLEEDFEEEIPADWTIENTTEEPNTWHWDETWDDIPMATVEGDATVDQEEWLISPTIDATDAEGTILEVDHVFTFNDDSWGRIQVSPDGGDTWELIEEYGPDHEADGLQEYDISDIADGEDEVQVGFEWESFDDDWDDWDIYEVNVHYLTEEYFNTTTFDLAAQEQMNVTFADWEPSSIGDYRVNITTDLDTDEDPTNDYQEEIVQVTDPEHDVAVDEIPNPESVVWNETQPVNATVSNYGDYDETDVPVNATAERVVGIMEDFSGEFPPAGWDTDDWTQSDTNNAGGEPPEAMLSWAAIEDDYAYLETPTLDTNDAEDLTLEFRSYINHYTDTFDARVLVRSQSGEDWTDVSPWENPIEGDVGPDAYEIDITEYIGPETQVMFEFDGDSWNINQWYIDDVMMGYTEEEYTYEVMVDLDIGESTTVEFVEWTPTVAGNYIFNVTAHHPEDANPDNATVIKDVHVRPIIYDLEATSIDAPEEPIYQYEEEVLGTVTNVGNQNITEETPVNMTIEPIHEDIPIDEDFSEGMPAGWTVEDRDGNDNTWEWSEEDESIMITPEDDMEHDVLWTEIADCTMGEHRVLLEFYSDFEGPNDRDLLISRDGGENYRKIGRNIEEGEHIYDITQYASEEAEVMIGWEFYSFEAEDDEFWEIDDVKITNEYTTEEYHSTAYVEELNVTESTQLQFDDWGPEELPSDYIIRMTSDHPEDDNMENVEIYERVFAREHVPPQAPEDPNPYDGEEDVTHSPLLNVTVYGDELLDMDVTFYLYDDDGNEIGNKTDEGVSNGTVAEVQFFLLETNSRFEWYVEVDDGIANVTSATWEFFTYEPEGMWKTATADINAEPPEPVENLRVDWDDDIWNVEGNEVTWDASPDDGAGADDTDHYVVYRSDSADGPWDETTRIDTVPAEGSADYTYFDEGRGDDAKIWHYVVRAVDRVDNMEMNENVASERPLPSAVDPDPADGEEVEELDQTVTANIITPTGEPLEVKFYHGTSRELLGEFSGVMNETLEVDYVELEEEDMGEDHYWFVVTSYEDYNIGSINPPRTFELEIEEPEGEGDVYVDGNLVEEYPYTEDIQEFSEVTLEADPESGWEFVEWTGDVPEDIAEDEEIVLTMDEDRSVRPRFADGYWHWLYDAEHRAPADTAIGATEAGVWYGAMVLDLSENIGQDISEVAYFDWADEANYVQAHVAEEDDGAPGEWLASTAEYTPIGDEWVELELDEAVEIDEPGEYWIVLEIDDLGDGNFPFGAIEPAVDDGQWANFGDPHDPEDWDDLSEFDLDYAFALEAFVDIPETTGGNEDTSLMAGEELNVAVIDEVNYQENEIQYNLEDHLADEYTVDTLEADELIDEMGNYEVFVPWRFGSDSLAEDFLDELEDHQTVVYLDSYEGFSAEGYGDAMARLHNVRDDPGYRWAESSTEPPVHIEIYEDHPIFEGIGQAGETVELYDGDTIWGSYYDDYSGDNLAEVQYGDGTTGHGVGISEDGREILLPAMSIDFFATADDDGWTEESWSLLANSVEYVSGELEFEPMGWHFHLLDTIPPEADAGEDIEAYQGDTITLNGTGSTDNVEVVNWTWTIEDPTGDITELYGPVVDYTLDYALYYDVTLTVYDGAGNSDTDAIEIYAIDTEDPVADAGVADQTQVGVEYTLNGTGSSDNVEVVEWTWYIEGVSGEADGYDDEVEGETVEYVFPYEGTYDVTLEVRDAEGNSDTDSIWMIVDSELFELNVNVEGEGEVDVYPHMDEYENGTEVELTAIPEEGWQFVEWTGDYEGTEEELTIVMDEDKNITAHFVDEAYFAVELVDHNAEVEEGEEVLVEYNVTNKGGLNGTQDIEFLVGTELISIEENITLEPGEEYNGEFTWLAEEAGEYDLVLRSEDDDSRETVVVMEPEDPPEPAYFEVNVIGYDEEVEEDQDILVSTLLMNTGEEEGTQEIEFIVDGSLMDSKEIPLSAGEHEIVEFTWQAEGQGDHTIEVASEDELEEVTVTISEREPAYFESTIVDYDTEVEEGEEVIVSYMLTNAGEEEGTQEIEFEVNGEVIETIEITLGAGEEYHGEFTWQVEEAGEYEIGLRTEDDDNWITIEASEIEPELFEVYIVGYDEEVEEGEELVVSVLVMNAGGEQGTQEIEFRVEDDIEDMQEITQGAGEFEVVEFVWYTEEGDAGDYNIEVESDDIVEEVTISVEEVEEEEEEDPGMITGTAIVPYLWILVIILLILVIILTIMLARKEPVEEEPEALFEEEAEDDTEDFLEEEPEEPEEPEEQEELFEEETEEDDLFEEDEEDLFGESDELDEDGKLFDE